MQRDNRLFQHLGGSIIAQFSCFPKELSKSLHEQLHWKWVCCWSTTPPLAGFSEPISAGHFSTNRRLLRNRDGTLILLCSSLRLVPFHLHLPFSQHWRFCHQWINVRSWFWRLWWGQMETKPLQSMELHQNLPLFTRRRAEHVKCCQLCPMPYGKFWMYFFKKKLEDV